MKDYATKGRLAVATPQANPTVEAEVRRILPNDVDYCTLRLLSESGDPKTRLIEYLISLPGTIKSQFSGLSVDSLLFGCTASSYLTDEKTEKNVLRLASEMLGGAQITTAAEAVKQYFIENNIKKIGILTPYPIWLQEHAEKYWTDRGVEIVATERVEIGDNDTYKIYDLSTSDARPGLMGLMKEDCDAVLISGTGMPSLRLISEFGSTGKKIVSSNYAMTLIGLSYLGLSPKNQRDWFN
jgi:maleate isomerase